MTWKDWMIWTLSVLLLQAALLAYIGSRYPNLLAFSSEVARAIQDHEARIKALEKR